MYGCVNLNGEQLPEYADIPWQYAAEDDEVGVIHTLVIHPAWSGKGKARELVAFCEEHCRKQGKRVIRLDTYVNNHPANTMYPRLLPLCGRQPFPLPGLFAGGSQLLRKTAVTTKKEWTTSTPFFYCY